MIVKLHNKVKGDSESWYHVAYVLAIDSRKDFAEWYGDLWAMEHLGFDYSGCIGAGYAFTEEIHCEKMCRLGIYRLRQCGGLDI